MRKGVITALFILAFIVQKADAIIVDIDARTNGPASPVQTFLLAGTYTVTPIGTVDGGAFDAWNAWGSTTCSDPNGCQRTDPSTVRGWLTTYVCDHRVESQILSATGAKRGRVAAHRRSC
jgi:hypothetical protein